MEMAIVYGEITNGCLILPPEALAILPSDTKLYMVTDPERGIVTIRAKDPTVRIKMTGMWFFGGAAHAVCFGQRG